MELSNYLYVLRRHYRLILLGPLLVGLAALLITFLLPPVYEAEAQLAIVNSGVVLNFEAKYRSVSEIDAANAANVDQVARRRALTTLAKSAALASGVID